MFNIDSKPTHQRTSTPGATHASDSLKNLVFKLINILRTVPFKHTWDPGKAGRLWWLQIQTNMDCLNLEVPSSCPMHI